MDIDIDTIVSGVMKSVTSSHEKKSYLGDKILKFEVGNEYVLKLLPWVKDGPSGLSKTFTYRLQYRWKPYSTHPNEKTKWIYITSSKSKNEKCPIDEWRHDFLGKNNGNSVEIKRVLFPLKRNESRICNALIVRDTMHPENNGKVVPIALNKTLWNIVDKALHGELDEEFSREKGVPIVLRKMIFQMINGVNLLVKVTSKDGGTLPNYENSRIYFGESNVYESIVPSDKDKIQMLENNLTIKQLIDARISKDVIDPEAIRDESIIDYAAAKKKFAHTFLNNPSISMHVDASWFGEDEKVVPSTDMPSFNEFESYHGDVTEKDAEIPTFDSLESSKIDEMDKFINELKNQN